MDPVSDRGFDGQVAQLVEHTTENRGVGGSIPSLAIESSVRFGPDARTRRVERSTGNE